MNKPEPIVYETPYKTVKIESLAQIKTIQGKEVVDGGMVKHNGKIVPFCITIDNKPDLVELIKKFREEWETYNAYKAAEFSQNVPGLEELENARTAAYNAEQHYQIQVDQAMEDGAPFPKNIDPALQQKAAKLAADYPRAVVYLNAKGYTYSNNINKYSAGKKAMEMIATGATIEEAKAVLENWLQ
jgi:hypothetical protein